MTELVKLENSSGYEEPGTEARRFLAMRGSLLVKEFKDIGSVRCDHNSRIAGSTLIITSANSAKTQKIYGVRFEYINYAGDTLGTAFLDYDELDELAHALDLIREYASKMSSEARDYTEVVYRTKDGVEVGFYQSGDKQQAYIKLGSYSDCVFTQMDRVGGIKQLIQAASSHLKSRGADN